MKRQQVGMFDAMLATLLMLFGFSLGLVIVGAVIGLLVKAVRALL